MFACRFDLAAMEVEYGGAGHPPPLLYRPDDGTVVQLACRCGILGVGNTYCDEPPLQRMSIKTGDVLVLYTDGLIEAINAQGEPFGQKRLEETVRGFLRDGRKLANSLIEAAKSFTGGYFQDDVLVLVVEIK
jgi:sigma-B regulation protein RsbU (phosphoserine phosphatase)